VPDGFDVVGVELPGDPLNINGSAPDYVNVEFFQKLITVSNGSQPVWQNVAATTTSGGSQSGNVFVPQTPEVYGYDDDGNLTSDGWRTG